MSDAKRYKAALVSQYSDVVLAIDHEAAIAAKDARIAELEAERDAWVERATSLQDKLDVAATPSEDGGEVPTPIALVRERDWNLEKTLFAVFYANSDPKPGDQLMTVAQCKRIVAAKDAEIARLRELHENAHSAAKTLMAEKATLMEQAAHWLEVNAPSGGCIETNIADELRAEAEQLRAQPARQVGDAAQALLPALRQYQHNDCSGFVAGYELEATQHIVAGLLSANGRQVTDDERERFEAAMGESVYFSPEGFEHDSGVWVYSDYTTDVAWMAWSRRAALATAAVAVVMPEVPNHWELHDANFRGGWEKHAAEVARLNRRAIPVELLERVCADADMWMEEHGEPVDGCYSAAHVELRALLGQD